VFLCCIYLIFTVLFFRTINTVSVVIALALLVTVASGLGYNSNNRYPSIRGNSWNTWGSIGGRLFDNGGWDLGHHGGYGRKYSGSA
jgi:hypothetical protein